MKILRSTIRQTSLLFLLFTIFPFIMQGQDIKQGCRRGTPRPRSMERRSLSQPRYAGGDFYFGERHQLTVLVAFNDMDFSDNESATLTQWNKILNTDGLHEEPFTGSVRDYFLAQSEGRFSLEFDLQYVTVEGNREKYRSTSAHDEYSQYLVYDVMDILEQRDIDWSLYDWNGDGFVNQLLIVFAGKGSGYAGLGGGHNAIWPHQWWLSEHLKDNVDGQYCEPRSVTKNGVTYIVDNYCAVQELSQTGTYASFGTICHEYTHCFGFPDFYGNGPIIGNWDLMDSGSYNGNNGFCPPNYSAHERWIMGWMTPQELTEATTITDMPALNDRPQAYFVRNEGFENEYYFIENRQQTGWDKYLPGSGVVIFHIEFDPEMWTSTIDYPNTSKRLHYTIIPANNNSSTLSQESWAYPYEGNNLLTNSSSPAAILWNANTDGTKYMSKPITNISITGDLASFDFMKEESSISCIKAGNTQSTTSHRVFDLQGRVIPYSSDDLSKGTYIIQGSEGKRLKVVK